ncbi:hypothetical protein CUU64_20910 [Bacillus sp. V5-8f]|nr:hypothetical protein CUU64_20910 [Bacillus sp. V5-8f]
MATPPLCYGRCKKTLRLYCELSKPQTLSYFFTILALYTVYLTFPKKSIKKNNLNVSYFLYFFKVALLKTN